MVNSRKVRGIAVGSIVTASLLLTAIAADAAVTTLAKFPPSRAGNSDVVGATSSDRNAFVLRGGLDGSIRIVSVNRHGSKRTVWRGTTARYSAPSVNWVIAGRGFVASILNFDAVSFWPELFARPMLVIGPERGKARQVSGATAGAIAGDGSLAAALRWNSARRLELLVFRVGSSKVRLVKRRLVPDVITATAPQVGTTYSKTVALDIKGDSAVIAGRGRAVVLNWKTGSVERTYATTPVDNLTVALTDSTVMINSTAKGNKYVSPAYEYAAYRRSDGQRIWMGTDFDPDLNIGHSLASLIPQSPSGERIERLNPENGVRNFIGSLASYGPFNGTELPSGRADIQRTRITWPEYGCYWASIITKPLAEVVSRPSPDCSLRVLPGSAELSGRTLSLRVRTLTGARFRDIYAKAGEYTSVLTTEPVAPGTRTIKLRLGPRVSNRLRRSSDRQLLIDFVLAPAGATSRFTGRVKIVD